MDARVKPAHDELNLWQRQTPQNHPNKKGSGNSGALIGFSNEALTCRAS
jgi:hypothetical protein